jgi:chitinase
MLKRFFFWPFLLASLFLSLQVACGGKGEGTPPPPGSSSALAITQQPANMTVQAGNAASFSVAATGGATPYHYQWFKGTTAVGQNAPTLMLATTSSTDAGTYSVQITDSSNPAKTMTSATATLTVTPGAQAPQITAFTATPAAITAGQSSVLAWTVTGATSLAIDQSVGPVTGTASKSVSPSATTTYTLTATNANGHSTATATVTVGGGTTPGQVWVMGYYVGYQGGDHTPAMVDYSSMTHIMVGAALPQNDGSFDTQFYIDPTNGPAWAKDTVKRAHAAGIKAILMIGGAGDANIAAFRKVSDPTIRAAFVNNLKTIVNDYGFDGIDLDWEPLSFSSPDDRPSILALAQALRVAMPTKVMTIPVGWNNSNFNEMAATFFGQLSASFDRVNMMSYGMVWCGSGWDSWHSSALYGNTGSTPSSIDDTTKALMSAGVPKAKIGIGMGFYGTTYEKGSWQNGNWVPATTGPYVTAPHQNTDSYDIRVSDNDVSYSNIMQYYYEASAYHWDDTAKAAYLSWATPKQIPVPAWATPKISTTYVTYEDETSIAHKGAYVKSQGLGGVIIWTISQGYLSWKTTGEKDPLMKATKAAFL